MRESRARAREYWPNELRDEVVAHLLHYGWSESAEIQTTLPAHGTPLLSAMSVLLTEGRIITDTSTRPWGYGLGPLTGFVWRSSLYRVTDILARRPERFATPFRACALWSPDAGPCSYRDSSRTPLYRMLARMVNAGMLRTEGELYVAKRTRHVYAAVRRLRDMQVDEAHLAEMAA